MDKGNICQAYFEFALSGISIDCILLILLSVVSMHSKCSSLLLS